MALAICLAACSRPPAAAPPPVADEPSRLLGASGSEPLAFRRVVYRIPSNRVIGRGRVGRRPPEEVRWTATRGSSKTFNVAVTDGLRARGFDLRDEADALFDPAEGAKVRYEMAAILHDADVDYRYSYDAQRDIAGEGKGTAKVEVEVRLHDAIEKRTVYARRFHGEGSDQGHKPNPITAAIVDAILQAADDPDFVRVVARDGGPTDLASDGALPRYRLATCNVPAGQSLPNDLPVTLEAVVEILAGGVGGSGVIVSPDGWIMTAAHVVLGAPEVWVRTGSGIQLPATVHDANAEADLALLRVPGKNFPCAPVREASRELDLGSDVFAVHAVSVAVGDDRSPTVTRGVVSGFPIEDGRRFIQTDASINLGSSGGPLLAPDGSIAGITVRKIIGIGVEGLSLAVPASEAIGQLSIELVD